MNSELSKQVTEYLETGSEPAVTKVLLKLLVAALEEKDRECQSLKSDLSSEKHSRALDSASPWDYL